MRHRLALTCGNRPNLPQMRHRPNPTPPITGRCLAARTWPCWDGLVPETAEQTARRKRLAYEAARRRSAVNLLRIMACTCDYASERLANGASPAEAAETMAFVTGELAEVAAALRKLTGLTGLSLAERRVRAAQLTRLGMTREEVGRRLGVSAKSVRAYLRAQAPELLRPRPALTSARQGARRGARPAAEGGR